MNKEEMLKHQYIWAFMYGKPVTPVVYANGEEGYEQDVLIRIETSSLICNREDTFRYVWGFPGPDYNVYKYKDYRETWCFHPNEIPYAKVHKDDIKYID